MLDYFIGSAFFVAFVLSLKTANTDIDEEKVVSAMIFHYFQYFGVVYFFTLFLNYNKI